MTSTRQLVAIMFTDIVGYSILMGRDSAKALDLVRQTNAIQKPLVEKHQGKWLKELGDGTLTQFGSALDAVKCAMDIQRASRADLDGVLRIAIHLGDVTVENDDVFGEGVNIASRLQAVVEPGGIYISESVMKAIHGSTAIDMVEVGEFELKNIEFPVKTFAIQGTGMPVPKKVSTSGRKSVIRPVLIGVGALAVILMVYFLKIYQSDEPSSPMVDQKAIAILPFANLSDDKEQQYFADGVMEDILTHLQRIGELRVPSRTSVEQYRSTDKPVTDIAQELNVGYLLEGSVRKSGNQVMITAQLIDAQKDRHLWADNFTSEYNAASLFDIQQEIALNIVEQLKLKILPEEIKVITEATTENTEAYEHYMRGREIYLARNPVYYDSAIAELKLATAMDPDFGQAYGLLANVYGLWWSNFDGDLELLDSAEYYANKGMETDVSCDWCYKALSFVQDGKYKNEIASMDMLEKALEINPNNSTARWNLMRKNTIHGRYEKAFPLVDGIDWEGQLFIYLMLGDIKTIRRLMSHYELKWGIEIYPQPQFLYGMARVYTMFGDAEKYQVAINRLYDIYPEAMEDMHADKLRLYWIRKEYDSVAHVFEMYEAQVTSQNSIGFGRGRMEMIAEAYYQLENLEASRRVAGMLKEQCLSSEGAVTMFDAANLVTAEFYLGNTEEALNWMKRSIELGFLFPYGQTPILEPLREHKEFMKLVEVQNQKRIDALSLLATYKLPPPEQTISNAEVPEIAR